MKQPSKQTIAVFLKEVISIIAAILLALAINETWESHERNERKTELVGKIYLELEESLAQLQASHQHHQDHLNLIRSATQGDASLSSEEYLDIYRTMYRKGIMRPALLTDTNWEIAKFTDLISYMDMDKLQSFTKVYRIFEVYNEQWRQNADAQLVAGASDDPRQLVDTYYQILNETWWIERNLIEAIEKSLLSKAAR